MGDWTIGKVTVPRPTAPSLRASRALEASRLKYYISILDNWANPPILPLSGRVHGSNEDALTLIPLYEQVNNIDIQPLYIKADTSKYSGFYAFASLSIRERQGVLDWWEWNAELQLLGYLDKYIRCLRSASWTQISNDWSLGEATIEDFEATTNWTIGGEISAAATSTAHYKVGSNSVRLVYTYSAGAGGTYTNSTDSHDISLFRHGWIGGWVYITDINELRDADDGVAMSLWFGNDAATNGWTWNWYDTELKSGWNFLFADLNDTPSGTIDYAAMDYVKFTFYGKSTIAATDYFYLDDFMLYQQFALGLPYGTTNGNYYYTAEDGSTYVKRNPPFNLNNSVEDITFDIADANINKSDVMLFDMRGETTETSWANVLNTNHVFSGLCCFDNGLIRVKEQSATNKWILQTWNGSDWTTVSDTLDLLLDNGDTSTSQFDAIKCKKVSPESAIIEISHANDDMCKLQLWRGRPTIKIEGKSLSGIITSISYAISDAALRFYVIDDDCYDADLESSNQAPTMAATADAYGIAFAEDVNVIYIFFVPDNNGWVFRQVANGSQLYAYNNTDFPAKSWTRTAWLSALYFDTSNLFKEAEDGTLTGATYYTGADFSPKTGNTGVRLDAAAENVVIGSIVIPTTGLYDVFIRAKGASASDTFSWKVDSESAANQDTTSSTTPGYYRVANKKSISAATHTFTIAYVDGTIDIDWVLFVPVENGQKFPGDIALECLTELDIDATIIERE